MVLDFGGELWEWTSERVVVEIGEGTDRFMQMRKHMILLQSEEKIEGKYFKLNRLPIPTDPCSLFE